MGEDGFHHRPKIVVYVGLYSPKVRQCDVVSRAACLTSRASARGYLHGLIHQWNPRMKGGNQGSLEKPLLLTNCEQQT